MITYVKDALKAKKKLMHVYYIKCYTNKNYYDHKKLIYIPHIRTHYTWI